jgi:AraC-like DNA-binding protein
MLLRDFRPHPALGSFVKCYRVVHFTFDKNADLGCKPYTPRPETCLVFYPYDRETVVYPESGIVVSNLPVVLVGQHSTITQRYINPNFLALQIQFQPGAFFRLTGIPQHHLHNVYMAADSVFSNDIHVVNEQLHFAPNYPVMIQILDQFVFNLVKKVRKDVHAIDRATQMMFTLEGSFNVDWLKREVYLSTKQLERKFKERMGVNPKVFDRLIRFDRAYRTKNAYPQLDWRKVAFDCGYYDYQHLVRDYKDFTGLSPNAFLGLEYQAPEQLLGMAEQFYQMVPSNNLIY